MNRLFSIHIPGIVHSFMCSRGGLTLSDRRSLLFANSRLNLRTISRVCFTRITVSEICVSSLVLKIAAYFVHHSGFVPTFGYSFSILEASQYSFIRLDLIFGILNIKNISNVNSTLAFREYILIFKSLKF